jgi:hypothetical protein
MSTLEYSGSETRTNLVHGAAVEDLGFHVKNIAADVDDLLVVRDVGNLLHSHKHVL